MSKPKTLTAKEAADLLALSPRYTRRLLASANISPILDGTTCLYPATAVKTLAKTRSKKTPKTPTKETHGA